MRAEVVERRQAVLSRLVQLRADGSLSGEVVHAAAESLGVGERSVWRWLAAGEYDPGKRSCWRTTPAAIEALYLAGGRPTAAWRLLSEEGVEVPSLPTFCRAVRRDVSLAERVYARHGEDGRRRTRSTAAGSRRRATTCGRPITTSWRSMSCRCTAGGWCVHG